MTDYSVFTENIELPYGSIDPDFVTAVLEKLYENPDLCGREVTVILCDNHYIAAINSNFRGKEGPTDVISFAECDMDEDFPLPFGKGKELGEIYISLERAAEQAPEFGTTPRGEVARLIIHGLLHLLGYDHEGTEEGAKIMEQKEDDLARTLSHLDLTR